MLPLPPRICVDVVVAVVAVLPPPHSTPSNGNFLFPLADTSSTWTTLTLASRSMNSWISFSYHRPFAYKAVATARRLTSLATRSWEGSSTADRSLCIKPEASPR